MSEAVSPLSAKVAEGLEIKYEGLRLRFQRSAHSSETSAAIGSENFGGVQLFQSYPMSQLPDP